MHRWPLFLLVVPMVACAKGGPCEYEQWDGIAKVVGVKPSGAASAEVFVDVEPQDKAHAGLAMRASMTPRDQELHKVAVGAELPAHFTHITRGQCTPWSVTFVW